MKHIIKALVLVTILSSCSSSKFDYQTAYKFSKYRYDKQQEQEQQQEQQQEQERGPQQEAISKALGDKNDLSPSSTDVSAVASVRPGISIPETLPSDHALTEMQTPEDATASFLTNYHNASKQEKKAIRKQVKQEYKTLRQQVKKADKETAAQDVVFNKKMYIGLVIFAAGLLVAILASGAVGAVGIIVGIALIAWGFIEQA